MQVSLLNTPTVATAECAARVCRNSKDGSHALSHALKAGHDSLMEHIVFQFSVSGISRACSHQLVRHRIGFSYAQQSQRHCIIDLSNHNWYVTPPDATPLFHTAIQAAGASYQECLRAGMATEDARYILPNATCTAIVITTNARALDNFFKLRCCKRAQWEIRELAEKMLYLCYGTSLIFDDKNYPDCKNCKEPCKYYTETTALD